MITIFWKKESVKGSVNNFVRRRDGRMAFVPEGQHDSSQARSVWTGVWTFSCASSKRPTGEQKTAQGFSPGNDTHKEIALKGRPNGIDYNVYMYCYMQWLSPFHI